MRKIRVLVVDDTVVIRRLVSEVISQDPEMEVVGIAPNGSVALQKLSQIQPDVVTLDLEMPEMDGLETLRELRRNYPRLPVIMLSSLTSKGAESPFDALASGASDYVAKPTLSSGMAETMLHLQNELLPRIKAHFRKANPLEAQPAPKLAAAPLKRQVTDSHPVDIVCVGTSTGGPNALCQLFEDMAEALPVPMVIVQHMPPVFTRTLAERLDRISKTRVFEGEEGQELRPGCAYLAPGGKHMEVRREGLRVVLRLNEAPPENSCRPAVDPLFRSVAETYGHRALAVVMTGMGKDGFLGCEAICAKGGKALAQDEASSVVWGMPGAAVATGLVDKVLPLEGFGPELTRATTGVV